MEEFTPTVNVTIDPHPDEQESAPAAAPAAPRMFEVVGMSFGIGVLVGGMLVFAFSRPTVCDA